MNSDNQRHFANHGGKTGSIAQALGRDVGTVLDFSASLNPLGTPDFIYEAFHAAVSDIGRYPDPEYLQLRTVAAVRLGIAVDNLVFGNGVDELLFSVIRTLVRDCLFIFEPSYGTYRSAANQAGLSISSFRLSAADNFHPDEAKLVETLTALPAGSGVCLGSPNNPTGILIERCQLERVIARFSQLIFIIDEAFIEFCCDPRQQSLFQSGQALPHNLVILRSLTKAWAIPGLRLGYAITAPDQADRLRIALQSWPVNCVAERVGQAIFRANDSHLASCRELIQSELPRLSNGLRNLGGILVFPSVVNYLLFQLETETIDNVSLHKFLAKRGIAVRSCASMTGLDSRYYRVAVRTMAENNELMTGIQDWLQGKPAPQIRDKTKRKTPALMIQGCSSSTGKSLLAAAFCRIFYEDGLMVKPFKAQNMSHNARITDDGGEIGVAQYIQAQAAGCEPDVRMNPVLLKPHTDTGAKIIVLGKPWGQAEAMAYGELAQGLSRVAFQAYDELAASADIMVMEGAGSPAEINLRGRDFVNMRAAIHASARVLLAGDIDRGGVFANFIGHVATFRPDERRHLAGFLVNKFRGDAALLGDAYDLTYQYTGIPVLGTIPYIYDLAIEEEDGTRLPVSRPDASLHLAVVRVPHISNAQDFDPFTAEADVCLEFVQTERELEKGDWDAIILPGSRSTVADLIALRECGIVAYIEAAVARGIPLIGICGGLQMLGRTISDASGVESNLVISAGLGLLDIDTKFNAAKVQSRVQASHLESGIILTGYEIRHGDSTLCTGLTTVDMERLDGTAIGFRRGAVWGSYLHGLFENDALRSRVVNQWRRQRNLPQRSPSRWVGPESELTRLAGIVRESCNMRRIYAELGID